MRGCFGDPNFRQRIPRIISEFYSYIPLLYTEEGESSQKLLKLSLDYVVSNDKQLVLVSSICPPYTTNEKGAPDYKDLGDGISYNIQLHFDGLVPAVKNLEKNGISVVHFFLMADTEVDLLPFLKKMSISPEEFISRCQKSIEVIRSQTESIYGPERYQKLGIPSAARFLDFFGYSDWFNAYSYFKSRLEEEVQREPGGRIIRALENDVFRRSILIERLLGNVTHKEKIDHLIRQRSQYMAFASLMRQKFGKALVIANHRTPNLYYMNDKITRESLDPIQKAHGNHLDKLPLIQLNIETLPT